MEEDCSPSSTDEQSEDHAPKVPPLRIILQQTEADGDDRCVGYLPYRYVTVSQVTSMSTEAPRANHHHRQTINAAPQVTFHSATNGVDSQPENVQTVTSSVADREHVREHIREHVREEVSYKRKASSLLPNYGLTTSAASTVPPSSSTSAPPLTTNYSVFRAVKKKIRERQDKDNVKIEVKPPPGFKTYLTKKQTYVLAGNGNCLQSYKLSAPDSVTQTSLRQLFDEQERARCNLRVQHQIEKERLMMFTEQQVLRCHVVQARSATTQTEPISACRVLKDQEILHKPVTDTRHVMPDIKRAAVSREQGERRLAEDVEETKKTCQRLKEGVILRQQNEAESLCGVQRMDWELRQRALGEVVAWTDKEVPMVTVEDFHLLPA